MNPPRDWASEGQDSTDQRELHGIAASPGIAIGPAFRFLKLELDVERRSIEDPTAEWERFQAAVETAQQQLEQVFIKAKEESGAEQASIFKAHSMMLGVPYLVGAVEEVVW